MAIIPADRRAANVSVLCPASRRRVRRRLLSYPDGERRLTNFLHLAELLHTACVEHRLGMNGLMKWLGQEIDAVNSAFYPSIASLTETIAARTGHQPE